MNGPAASPERAGLRLRSWYDPDEQSISIELATGPDPLPGGARLAFTSVVQLTAHAPVELVRRLATYHEFALGDQPLIPGSVWAVADLQPSHRAYHSNDGPLSAFVILPDETTVPVSVEPMQRLGGEPGDGGNTVASSAGGPLRGPMDPPIVPYPVLVEVSGDAPNPHRTAYLTTGDEAARKAWSAISELEQRVRGGTCLESTAGIPVSAAIEPGLAHEAYDLTIGPAAVGVRAGSQAGLRHAFVTLARWLPAGLPWSARVQDQPTYQWRGLHVDLARRWFEPELVEWLIDVAAWRKLSRLHLHLTDDEAWRLPVDAYPELAAAGTRGYRRPLPPMLGDQAGPSGRCYTADEIERWVARADRLGVTLIPEVDLPAHAHAALTALPHLRDPDDRSNAVSVQYFTNNVIVPGHPLLGDFLAAVVDSSARLFPSSPWIHIGGDEVPEGAWAGSPIVARYRSAHRLQSTRDVEGAFHRELAAIVHRRTGRSVGAWQEAAESGGIRPGDGYVVGWRTPSASRRLAAAGYDVVASPAQAYYLDMALDDRWTTPGASWNGSVSLEDVCRFVPDAGWTEEERGRLLGIQACLWTEYVADDDVLRRQLFPRLDAIAERAWSGRIHGGPSSLRARAMVGE